MAEQDRSSTAPHAGMTTASHCAFVTGDRLCVQCGYNLIGQSILREPHYNLLIARCPECGAVTGVQEYPLLGPWAHRWGMLIAALWFITILGLWAGSSGTIMGLSLGVAEEAGWEYQQYISRLHDQYVEQQRQQQAAAQSQTNLPQPTDEGEQEQKSDSPSEAGTAASAPAADDPQAQAAPPLLPTVPAIPNLPAGSNTTVIHNQGGIRIIGGGTGGGIDFATWWKQQDREAILASAGGWIGAVDWEIIAIWVLSALLIFVIGCFWAVALVQLRRSRLLLWALVILALAWLFALIPLIDWLRSDATYSWWASRQQVSPPLLICSLALFTIPLGLGLLLGRPIVRQTVRGLLPPRLRGSLALLWTTDGKRPPVGGYSNCIRKA